MYKYLSSTLISMWAINLSYQGSHAAEANNPAYIDMSPLMAQAVAQEKFPAEKLVQFITDTVSSQTTETILVKDDLRRELVAMVILQVLPRQILAICEHINHLDEEQRRAESFNYLHQILSNRVMSLSEMIKDGFKIDAHYNIPYGKLKIDEPLSEEQLFILASNPYLKELELRGTFKNKGIESLARALADHPAIQLLKMKATNKADLLEYSEQFEEPAKTKLKKILLTGEHTDVLKKTVESYRSSGWDYSDLRSVNEEIITISFNDKFRACAKDYPEVIYDALSHADADEWYLSSEHLDIVGTRALALALKTCTRVKYLSRTDSRLTLPVAQALKVNQSLKGISFNAIYQQDVEEAVAEALRTRKNFRSLRIFYFKTNGLALSAALKETSCLKHLSLSEMNPKAIKALAEGLFTNTSLKYLFISNSAFGKDNALTFIEALNANKIIKYLKCYNCGLNEADLQRMQAIVEANRLAHQQIQARK